VASRADPEDGGDMFLRNVCLLSTDYTAFYPRRQYFSNVTKVAVTIWFLGLKTGGRETQVSEFVPASGAAISVSLMFIRYFSHRSAKF
jgi:hypothetical protein